MSKQQFTRSFNSLAEFRDGFGEAYVEAQGNKGDAAVSRLRREQRGRKVETGVAFVPAEGKTLTRAQRRAQQKVIDDLASAPRIAVAKAVHQAGGR